MKTGFFFNKIAVMTLLAVGGLFLLSCPLVAEQAANAGDKQLKPSSCTFNVDPMKTKNSVVGQAEKALINGEKNTSEDGRRPIWCFRDFNRKPVVIQFTFDTPAKFSRAKVYYYRYLRGYGIKTIMVYGIAPDGTQQPLGGIHPNQPYEIKKPEYACFDIPLDSETAVSRIALDIKGISYLGLTEVEFYGKAEEQEKPPATTSQVKDNPFDVLAQGNGHQELSIAEKDLNNDGSKEIVLENSQMIYVIEPACGGVVNYAFDKNAKGNLIKLRTTSGEWGGVFSDCLVPGRHRSDWAYAKYNYEITDKTKDKISVKLSLQGKTGSLRWVTFEKTYTLYSNNAAMKVDYRFINGIENVVPIEYGLWFHSGMGSPDEEFRIFYTTPLGVMSQPTGKQLWNYDSTRGWIGIVTKSGRGCAILNDYKYLKSHYFWATGGKYTTLETRFGKYPVKAGESLNTTAWLIPFFGIGIPEGVTPYMTGRFELKDKYTQFPATFDVSLKPSVAGKYSITVEAKRLPNGDWKQLLTAEQELSTDPVKLKVNFKPDNDGSYVFRAKADSFGKEVFEMEVPAVIGKQSGDYAMAPSEPKLPVPGERKAEKEDLVYNSLDYVTPHVNWAKPFAGGKPKVLFLSRKRGGIRDSVEVAERFEMDFDNSYIVGFLSGGLYDLGAYYAKMNKTKCLAEVNKLLSANKYDCIVVSSALWKYLGDQINNKILEMVKQGTGLVLIAPENLPSEIANDFKLPAKAKRVEGTWKLKQQHFITSGIPFAALPPTQVLPYATTGEVLATAADKPLAGIFNYGKGRIAAAGWVVGGRDREGYYAENSARGFLPNLMFLGVGDIQYNYWEYQLSFLAKMIYWAAKHETAVNGKSITVANDSKVILEFDSAKAEALTVELTIRDKFYRVEQTKKLELKASPGLNKLSLEFDRPGLEGIHLADVILKSAKGTEWWGTASFNVDNGLKIDGISGEREIWKSSETFTCKVKTTGNMSGRNIEIALIDGFGRVFARQEKALKNAEEQFAIPLKNSRGMIFTIKASIKQGNAVIAENKRPFILYGTPDAHKMQVAFGWPWVSMNGYQRFLVKDYFGRLKTLGATALRLFHTDTKFEVYQARELDLPILQSPSPMGTGGKIPFNQQAKDKEKLVRTPCFSTPGIQEEFEQRNAKRNWQDDFGALYRGGPDEANSIGEWDGCCSVHCQKEFRNWLKDQYKSLDALNREWATDYTGWDQVTAMSTADARKHKSYAPWHDLRTFNEWNWARSLASVKRGVRKIAPDMRYSLSGTQETSAFNAWDWYRHMQVLDAVESYGGEQTIMQRCFKQGFLCWTPWIGYNSDERTLDWQIIDALFMGATGFAVYSGGFSVNPDFTFPRASVDLKAALDKVKGGKAEVIMNSDYKAYPIAFLYSPASIKTDWMINKFEQYKSEVQGFKDLLADAGSDYDYIAYEQLENSSLLKDKYKLLYLPLSTALSDAQITRIEDFVKAGGVVVTDMQPGSFTQHGAPRPDTSRLDKLFGISRSSSRIVDESAALNGKTANGIINLTSLDIPVKSFETGINTTTGKAFAAINYQGKSYPACIVNQYGKGCALYFACDAVSTFGEWKEMRFFKSNLPQVKILTGLVGDLFKYAGIKPLVSATVEDGSKLAATQCFLRQNGPAYIVGLVRNYMLTRSIDTKIHAVTVKLFGKFHCYDLMRGQYLGFGDKLESKAGPFTHNVFVLLPYQVKAVTIDGPDNAEPGLDCSFNIALKADTDKFAKHTLNIEVLDPSGTKQEAYSGIQFTDNSGRFKLDIPVALNSAEGTWKIVVTDVMTGTKGNLSLKVK